MGVVGFKQKSEGATAQEAFDTAVQLAKLMNGIGGHEAEIHKKTGFIEIKQLPQWIVDPNCNVLFKILSLAEDVETERVIDKSDNEPYSREEYFGRFLDQITLISVSGTDEERYAGERLADDLFRHLARFVEVIGLERLFMILDWRSSTDGICLAVEAYEGSWIFFGATSKQKSKYRRGGRQF